MQIANNLREQVYRFRVIYLKDYSSNDEVIKEHVEICSAVVGKDSNAAREAAKKHIRNQEQIIVNAIKRTNLN